MATAIGEGPATNDARRAARVMVEAKPGNATIPGAGAGIRVLCVDDHEVLVEGLKAQFGIDGTIRVVGWLDSAERLLDETARLKPDVVLLDIEMPGPDAFEMADRVGQMFPRVRVVFLSAHVRDGYIAAAHRCGACGYFAKGDDLKSIVAGIHEVVRQCSGRGGGDGFVMGPKVRERCLTPQTAASRADSDVGRATDGPPPTHLAALTEREIAILRLIGKGRSRAEIARELARSTKTIDSHQNHLMNKLGVKSRAGLLRFAIREGFAEP
ncbi:MAG: response regulator transcription factor [Phycisphaerales bacterium]